MQLNINGPAYYEQKFSLDVEVKELFKLLVKTVEDKTYGDGMIIFDYCPVIAPKALLDQGLWENSVSYSKTLQRGTVFIQIDYQEYIEANVDKRKALIVASLLDSAKYLKKRIGKQFDYNKFEKDLLEATRYDKTI